MAAVAILKKNRKIAGLTDRHHSTAEIRQFRTCTLKNDSVRHNGLSYGAYTTFHRTYFIVFKYCRFSDRGNVITWAYDICVQK